MLLKEIRLGSQLASQRKEIEALLARVKVKDRSILLEAAYRGYFDLVKELIINESADINQRDDDGRTVLMIAAEYGEWEIVKWLVEQDEKSINKKDHKGRTVLMRAAEYGQLEIVKWLVESNQVSSSDEDIEGQTALMYAARRGQLEVVKWLVEKDEKSVTKKDHEGQTVLMKAAEYGQLKVMEWLVEKDEKSVDEKNNQEQTVLMIAAKSGQLKVVQWLAETKKVAVNGKDNNGWTTLMTATLFGHWDVVKWLIETNNDKNNEVQKVLWWAARSGQLDLVQWLINTNKASVNIKDSEGRTVLWASSDEFKVMQWLVGTAKALIDIKDNEDRTVLLYAARFGNLEVVKWLIETAKASVKDKDNKDRTVLMHAARHGQLDMVQWLVNEKRLSIYDKDKNGRTVLMYAARSGWLEVVKWLVERDEKLVNEKDKDGRTVLMNALQTIWRLDFERDVVKWLVETKKVSVSEKDAKGWTVLMYAAQFGQLKVAKCLAELERASLSDENKEGQTALMIAARFGQLEVVKCLAEMEQASVSKIDKYGWTALMIAARFGELEIVKHLANTDKVSVDDKNKELQSALMLAAKYGEWEVVKWLIETAKVSVNTKDNEGWTALMLAARDNQFEIAQWLLEQAIKNSEEFVNDIKVKEKIDLFDVYYVCLRTLIEDKNSKLLAHEKYAVEFKQWICTGLTEKQQMQIITLAAKNEDISLDELIPALYPDEAIKLDNKESNLTNHLLSFFGRTRLLYIQAAFKLQQRRQQDKELSEKFAPQIEEIKNSLASKNEKNKTILLEAASNGYIDLVEWFIQSGRALITDKDEEGRTLLIAAAESGQLELVKWLIETGNASVNETNNDGWTVLMNAARYGQLKVVKWLIKNQKAFVSDRDDKGWTALMAAAYFGQLEVMEWLVGKGGAAVDDKNNVGRTALMIVADIGELKVVKWLKKKGASLTKKDMKGRTALMFAAMKRHVEVAQWLFAQNIHNYESSINDSKIKEKLNFIYICLKTLIEDKNYILLANEKNKEEFKCWIAYYLFTEQKINLINLALKTDGIDEGLLPKILAKEIEQVFDENSLTHILLSFFTDKHKKFLKNWYEEQQQQALAADVSDFEAVTAKLQSDAVPFANVKVESPANLPSETQTFIEAEWVTLLKLPEAWDKTQSFRALGGTTSQWSELLKSIKERFQIAVEDILDDDSLSKIINSAIRKRCERSCLHPLFIANTPLNQRAASLILIHPISGAVQELNTLGGILDKAVLNQQNLSVLVWRSPILKMKVGSAEFDELYESLCTMEGQAKRAIEGIQAFQPHGPYYLCGWSYGGALTLEIARLLQAQGEEVKYIGLIDTQMPHQLRALDTETLADRLLMHINYISGMVLQIDKLELLDKQTLLASKKTKVALIEQAFELAFEALQQYENQNQDKNNKLKSFLYTFKANYLAIYNYYPENQLRGEHQLPAATVYVASDKAGPLHKKEYSWYDLAGMTQVKPNEPIIPNTDHFNIVVERQFANLLTQHINDIDKIALSNKLWGYLEDHYHTLDFTHLQFLYDDVPFDITQCEFSSQVLTSGAVEIDKLYTDPNAPAGNCHVWVNGNMGSGKNIQTRQLTLTNVASKIWPQKKWTFHLPVQSLQAYTQVTHHPIDDDNKAIEALLYHHFFKVRGVSFAEVETFWDYIKQAPHSICFLLVGIEGVIEDPNPALQNLWRTLFHQPASVMVFSRDYHFNRLKKLGFSPKIRYKLEEFNHDDYTKTFIERYYQALKQPDLGQALWDKLKSLSSLRMFCRTPLHLTLVCSSWRYLHHDLQAQDTFTLSTLFDLCVKNMFRRYLQRGERVPFGELEGLPDESLTQLTTDVAEFLERCAFESVKAQQPVLSPGDIRQWLMPFCKDKTFFKRVLISGFLHPAIGYAQNTIDRPLQFNSPAISLYFACRYVHRQLALPTAATPEHLQADKDLFDFIQTTVKQYDFELIKAFLLDPLAQHEKRDVLIRIMTHLLNKLSDDYEITIIKCLAYCCELTAQLSLETPLRHKALERIGPLLFGFSSRFAKPYKIEGQANHSEADSLALLVYKKEILTLKSYCLRLWESIQNDKAFTCVYKGHENLLHYAVRKKAIAFMQFLLKQGIDTEFRNDKAQRPIDVAVLTKFEAGVKLLLQHRADVAEQQLYERYEQHTNNTTMQTNNFTDSQHWRNRLMSALNHIIATALKGQLKQVKLRDFIQAQRDEIMQTYFKRWQADIHNEAISTSTHSLWESLTTLIKVNSLEAETDNTLAGIQEEIIQLSLANASLAQMTLFQMFKAQPQGFYTEHLLAYSEANQKEAAYNLINKQVLRFGVQEDINVFEPEKYKRAIQTYIMQWHEAKLEDKALINNIEALIQAAIKDTLKTDSTIVSGLLHQNALLFLTCLIEQYQQRALREWPTLEQAIEKLLKLIYEQQYGESITKAMPAQLLQNWPSGDLKQAMQSELDKWLFEQTDKREPLSEEEFIKTWLNKKKTPLNFQLGLAMGKEDAFFDAVAQGLNQIESQKWHTVKSLRSVCQRFAMDVNHVWLKKAVQSVIQDKNNLDTAYQNYVKRILVASYETKQQGCENVSSNEELAIYGRPLIEGRIFCKQYNIRLHIIEVYKNKPKETEVFEYLYDSEGQKKPWDPAIGYNDTAILHIVYYDTHFVPLLDSKALLPQLLNQNLRLNPLKLVKVNNECGSPQAVNTMPDPLLAQDMADPKATHKLDTIKLTAASSDNQEGLFNKFLKFDSVKTATIFVKKDNEDGGKFKNTGNHVPNNDFEKRPWKTKGLGDCGLHDVFGKWKSYQQVFACSDTDIQIQRQKIVNAIRNSSSQMDTQVYTLVQEAIKALVMDNTFTGNEKIRALQEAYQEYCKINDVKIMRAWSEFENKLKQQADVIDYIKDFIENFCKKTNKPADYFKNLKEEFYTCLDSNEENNGTQDKFLEAILLSIPDLYQAYIEYRNQCSINFDWSERLSSQDIVEEYAHYIGRKGQWLLPVELNMLALIFNISIEFYSIDPRQRNAKPIYIDTYNREAKSIVSICFNGRDHYQRMANRVEIEWEIVLQNLKQEKSVQNNNNTSFKVYHLAKRHIFFKNPIPIRNAKEKLKSTNRRKLSSQKLKY